MWIKLRDHVLISSMMASVITCRKLCQSRLAVGGVAERKDVEME